MNPHPSMTFKTFCSRLASDSFTWHLLESTISNLWCTGKEMQGNGPWATCKNTFEFYVERAEWATATKFAQPLAYPPSLE